MSKVILITGCSSGIGLATSILLAEKGNKVYATMRNLDKKDKLENEAKNKNVNVNILQLDVTDENSVKSAVNEIKEKEGKIDVLVNNAGYGMISPVEYADMRKVKKLFEVNFFGLIRVTQACLPIMRKQSSGHIINISSIAGVRGLIGLDLYCASKFAVEGLSESMAPALKTMGINISLIEPGPVNTEFLNSEGRGSDLKEDNPYSKVLEKMTANRMERYKTIGQSSEDIAIVINEAITAEKPHLRYPTSDSVREKISTQRKDPTGDSFIKDVFEQLKL